MRQLASALFIFLPISFLYGEYQDGMIVWNSRLFIAIAIGTAVAIAYTVLIMLFAFRSKSIMPILNRFLLTFFFVQVVMQVIRGLMTGVKISSMLIVGGLLLLLKALFAWMRRLDETCLAEVDTTIQ